MLYKTYIALRRVKLLKGIIFVSTLSLRTRGIPDVSEANRLGSDRIGAAEAERRRIRQGPARAEHAESRARSRAVPEPDRSGSRIRCRTSGRSRAGDRRARTGLRLTPSSSSRLNEARKQQQGDGYEEDSDVSRPAEGRHERRVPDRMHPAARPSWRPARCAVRSRPQAATRPPASRRATPCRAADPLGQASSAPSAS